MRYILFVGLILFSSLSGAAPYQCDTIIQNPGYKACFNYNLKATLFVQHVMRVKDLKAPNLERKSMRFYEETKIPKRFRPTLKDWRGSGFDRGHMVSDATANYSRKTQKATYSLVNVSHQYPKMNRGIWKYVEITSRKLAKRKGGAKVITGSVFERISNKRVGPSLVAVPTYSFKILKFGDGDKLAFLVPNLNKNMGKKASKYKVPISKIEKMTGYSFKGVL